LDLMAEKAKAGWNRREFVGAAGLLAIALGLPGCVTATTLEASEAPSDGQLAMLREVAQIVIPATDTPGAGDAGVGAFVAMALAHGMEATRAPLAPAAQAYAAARYLRAESSLRYVDWLDDRLGADFMDQAPAARIDKVRALDTAAYAADAGAHPWRKVKGLILLGYYTSEIGGAQELQYAPLPGRFDPAVPVQPGERAYSNEWTGVDFG
jgi:Gluconate 2-dehydrogenase subunit 3